MKYIYVSFLLLFFTLYNVEAQNQCNVRVASYNLRMDTSHDGDDAWPNRKELVKGLVRFHDFDVFGTQEGFAHMLKGITELDEYEYIGVGRDDGKEEGEHSAIIYKKDRFELLDKGDFWLSQTPEVPSYGWDAEIKRICSWGKFRDKNCGKEFYFFSVHYDHIAKEARRESSKLMIQRIKNMVGDHTFFCAGDFNASPDSEPIQVIYQEGTLIDSKKISEQSPYGPEGTFQGFNIEAPLKDRIDYIFVSKDVKVKKYGVLTDIHYGHYPSDHFPILIEASY